MLFNIATLACATNVDITQTNYLQSISHLGNGFLADSPAVGVMHKGLLAAKPNIDITADNYLQSIDFMGQEFFPPAVTPGVNHQATNIVESTASLGEQFFKHEAATRLAAIKDIRKNIKKSISVPGSAPVAIPVQEVAAIEENNTSHWGSTADAATISVVLSNITDRAVLLGTEYFSNQTKAGARAVQNAREKMRTASRTASKKAVEYVTELPSNTSLAADLIEARFPGSLVRSSTVSPDERDVDKTKVATAVNFDAHHFSDTHA